MNIKTKKLITKIKENYDINNLDNISILPFGGEDVLYIQDTMYDIPEDLDDAELDELASDIIDDIIDKDKEEKKDIILGDIYTYEPKEVAEITGDTDESYPYDIMLAKISNYKPKCKVINILSSDSNDEDLAKLCLVTFDIDENKELNIPEDLLNEEYVVFDYDLKDIPVKKVIKEDINITEDDESIEKGTALLAALDSEKEAVELYQKLLEVVKEKDEIELLTKILDDEKEHIALLSGLQSSKTANSVANDNKKQLNDYAKDIIQALLE